MATDDAARTAHRDRRWVLLSVVVVWLLLFDPARAGRHRVRANSR
jgi:hypothetical protein